MVIDKINVQNVPSLEAENNPPVSGNGDGPKAFEVTLERMKPKTRQVHLLGRRDDIQAGKDAGNLVHEGRWQAFRGILFIEPLHAFMPKALAQDAIPFSV